MLVASGLAASAALAVHGGEAGAGARVEIRSGGSLYASYPLSEDRSVTVPAPKQISMDAPEADPGAAASERYDYYNIVEISGGRVSVSESSCKNQVCVRHGSISGPGQSIVCLPNRLVVSIEGGTEGGAYDTVTS